MQFLTFVKDGNIAYMDVIRNTYYTKDGNTFMQFLSIEIQDKNKIESPFALVLI